MRETYAEVVYATTRRNAARTTKSSVTEHASERMQLFARSVRLCIKTYLLYTVSCAVVRSLVGRLPSSRR